MRCLSQDLGKAFYRQRQARSPKRSKEHKMQFLTMHIQPDRSIYET